MTDFTERDLAMLLLVNSGSTRMLSSHDMQRLLDARVAEFPPADVPSIAISLTPIGNRVIAEALAAARDVV